MKIDISGLRAVHYVRRLSYSPCLPSQARSVKQKRIFASGTIQLIIYLQEVVFNKIKKQSIFYCHGSADWADLCNCVLVKTRVEKLMNSKTGPKICISIMLLDSIKLMHLFCSVIPYTFLWGSQNAFLTLKVCFHRKSGCLSWDWAWLHSTGHLKSNEMVSEGGQLCWHLGPVCRLYYLKMKRPNVRDDSWNSAAWFPATLKL